MDIQIGFFMVNIVALIHCQNVANIETKRLEQLLTENRGTAWIG